MNRYKKLAVNSVIFAIGNLGSKLISLLLIPLYTYYLSTKEYGTVDLLTTTVGLVVPILSLSIYDAVLRFVMDRSYDKKKVLNNALFLTVMGYILFCLLFPIFKLVLPFRDYLLYFYLMMFTSSINSSLMQFTRANGQVRLFASIGIISSIIILVGNILFLILFHFGMVGYLISLIAADLFSTVLLISVGKIYKYLAPSNINFILLKEMLIYSIPLMPNALMWWVMNVSDRYIVTYFIGASANGLYAVANKIPNILNMINSIFIQAWQMSAIETADSKSKSQFYSNVFNVLATAMFVGTSLLLLFLKTILRMVISPEFFSAWKYVPFLLLGTVFSSFASFLGTNYIAAKNTVGVFRTSIIGAIVNIAVNFALIPVIGTNGASISTMLSFLVIWLIRIEETKSFVTVNFNIKKLSGNILIILFQIILIYSNIPFQMVLQFLLFILLILLNYYEMKLLGEKGYQYIKKKTRG
ncbi:MAG: oligosaccharide flippase family protein [Sporolactobacillus sp.]|nr:oligosaccharide flippase family protein [Sporolactobacillus sp.]